MLGREAPLDFFRRSGIPIRGEWKAATRAAFAAFFLFCVLLYNWKAGGASTTISGSTASFRTTCRLVGSRADSRGDARGGTLAISLRDPGFYYSLAYCLAVLVFGIRRIRRRNTPYVTAPDPDADGRSSGSRSSCCPFVLLPWLGHNGAFDARLREDPRRQSLPRRRRGHGREYWRAFGFILAWPLFIWNVFSSKPMPGWLVIAFVQTFVLIPLIIRRWGKGAYCGWICSCGALAETLGDAHRQKMPHGPSGTG